NELNSLRQPFVSGLFSLSSHHPFRLPPDYIPSGVVDHPFLESMRYTDYSLKYFFEIAKRQAWYKNTLFVITSDHTSLTSNHSGTYSTSLGKYRIPLIIFKPDSDLKGVNSRVVQQLDIVPSILDFLNINL